IFDLGSGNLNLNGITPAGFANANGTGTINLNGSTTLGAGNGAAGTFQPSLHVLSGTATTSSATIDGSLTVDQGAVLNIAGNGTMVLNGDLTVTGVFGKSGGNGTSTSPNFNGSQLTNTGSLLADFLIFNNSGIPRSQ